MIFSIIRSLFTTLAINIKIIYLKYKNKKIIFFYYPSKQLAKPANYIEYLFHDFGKDFAIFFGFNSQNIVGDKNHYYIKYGFLKWIYNVDIFFDNMCVDVFTNKSIKIYMHHDIYDTPLVNIAKEKELFERIIKYDFLFLSNKKNINMFKNFFDKYNSVLNNNIPKTIESGYVKLDYLKKNINKIDLKNNNVVIAPTNHLGFNELSLFHNLEQIIENLLKYTSSKIIFRPHPANRKTETTLKIKSIFKDNKNFNFDESNDYFHTYLNSVCLISDVSGTAYTYAFLTKKPVIFFSTNEKLVNKLDYDKLAYFKDRNKVGVVVSNLKEMQEAIINIHSIQEEKKISIDILEKEMNYLGNSKSRIKEIINQIVENKCN